MSDHLPVIVNRKFLRPMNNGNQHTVTYRDIKSLKKEQIVSSLHEFPGTAPLCLRILTM